MAAVAGDMAWSLAYLRCDLTMAALVVAPVGEAYFRPFPAGSWILDMPRCEAHARDGC